VCLWGCLVPERKLDQVAIFWDPKKNLDIYLLIKILEKNDFSYLYYKQSHFHNNSTNRIKKNKINYFNSYNNTYR